MFSYHEHAPPPQLRSFIRCIWQLRDDTPQPQGAEPVLPDGCVEVVINSGDRFRRHAAGATELQPRRLIAGQLTHAITIEPTGTVDLLGIRFQPWGAAAFLGVSGDELRDRMLTLGDVPHLDRAIARVDPDAGDADRIAAMWRLLGERAARVAVPDSRIASLAAHVWSEPPRRVRDFAREFGVSSRRVQTMFSRYVGLTPKSLVRIARLQRSLALARARPALSWGRIAIECGYYDQAHLAHDARRITGAPLSQLVVREGGLTDTFIGVGDDLRHR